MATHSRTGPPLASPTKAGAAQIAPVASSSSLALERRAAVVARRLSELRAEPDRDDVRGAKELALALELLPDGTYLRPRVLTPQPPEETEEEDLFKTPRDGDDARRRRVNKGDRKTTDEDAPRSDANDQRGEVHRAEDYEETIYRTNVKVRNLDDFALYDRHGRPVGLELLDCHRHEEVTLFGTLVRVNPPLSSSESSTLPSSSSDTNAQSSRRLPKMRESNKSSADQVYRAMMLGPPQTVLTWEEYERASERFTAALAKRREFVEGHTTATMREDGSASSSNSNKGSSSSNLATTSSSSSTTAVRTNTRRSAAAHANGETSQREEESESAIGDPVAASRAAARNLKETQTVLERLRTMPVSRQALAKCGIGILVTRLRKHPNSDISRLASAIKKVWMQVLEESEEGGVGSSSSSSSSAAAAASSDGIDADYLNEATRHLTNFVKEWERMGGAIREHVTSPPHGGSSSNTRDISSSSSAAAKKKPRTSLPSKPPQAVVMMAPPSVPSASTTPATVGLVSPGNPTNPQEDASTTATPEGGNAAEAAAVTPLTPVPSAVARKPKKPRPSTGAGDGGEGGVPPGKSPTSVPEVVGSYIWTGTAVEPKGPHAERLLSMVQFLMHHLKLEYGSSLVGWRLEMHRRKGGSTLGQCDSYFFSPDGRRYRSKNEVAKSMGIVLTTTVVPSSTSAPDGEQMKIETSENAANGGIARNNNNNNGEEDGAGAASTTTMRAPSSRKRARDEQQKHKQQQKSSSKAAFAEEMGGEDINGGSRGEGIGVGDDLDDDLVGEMEEELEDGSLAAMAARTVTSTLLQRLGLAGGTGPITLSEAIRPDFEAAVPPPSKLLSSQVRRERKSANDEPSEADVQAAIRCQTEGGIRVRLGKVVGWTLDVSAPGRASLLVHTAHAVYRLCGDEVSLLPSRHYRSTYLTGFLLFDAARRVARTLVEYSPPTLPSITKLGLNEVVADVVTRAQPCPGDGHALLALRFFPQDAMQVEPYYFPPDDMLTGDFLISRQAAVRSALETAFPSSQFGPLSKAPYFQQALEEYKKRSESERMHTVLYAEIAERNRNAERKRTERREIKCRAMLVKALKRLEEEGAPILPDDLLLHSLPSAEGEAELERLTESLTSRDPVSGVALSTFLKNVPSVPPPVPPKFLTFDPVRYDGLELFTSIAKGSSSSSPSASLVDPEANRLALLPALSRDHERLLNGFFTPLNENNAILEVSGSGNVTEGTPPGEAFARSLAIWQGARMVTRAMGRDPDEAVGPFSVFRRRLVRDGPGELFVMLLRAIAKYEKGETGTKAAAAAMAAVDAAEEGVGGDIDLNYVPSVSSTGVSANSLALSGLTPEDALGTYALANAWPPPEWAVDECTWPLVVWTGFVNWIKANPESAVLDTLDSLSPEFAEIMFRLPEAPPTPPTKKVVEDGGGESTSKTNNGDDDDDDNNAAAAEQGVEEEEEEEEEEREDESAWLAKRALGHAVGERIRDELFRDTRTEEELLGVCDDLVRQLMMDPENEPFTKPVDRREFPDYDLIIKRPMDLMQIHERIASGHYDTKNAPPGGYEWDEDIIAEIINCSDPLSWRKKGGEKTGGVGAHLARTASAAPNSSSQEEEDPAGSASSDKADELHNQRIRAILHRSYDMHTRAGRLAVLELVASPRVGRGALANAPDCGKCRYCLDKPRFGGYDVLRMPCQTKQSSLVAGLGVTGATLSQGALRKLKVKNAWRIKQAHDAMKEAIAAFDEVYYSRDSRGAGHEGIAADVRLVFRNCLAFNKGMTPIYRLGAKLDHYFGVRYLQDVVAKDPHYFRPRAFHLPEEILDNYFAQREKENDEDGKGQKKMGADSRPRVPSQFRKGFPSALETCEALRTLPDFALAPLPVKLAAGEWLVNRALECFGNQLEAELLLLETTTTTPPPTTVSNEESATTTTIGVEPTTTMELEPQQPSNRTAPPTEGSSETISSTGGGGGPAIVSASATPESANPASSLPLESGSSILPAAALIPHEPLGVDRLFRRYWASPELVRELGWIPVEDTVTGLWGFLDEPEAVRALPDSLDPRGRRENHLRRHLRRHLPQIAKTLEEVGEECARAGATYEASLETVRRVSEEAAAAAARLPAAREQARLAREAEERRVREVHLRAEDERRARLEQVRALWKEARDPTGKPYYYHETTRETQWERPHVLTQPFVPRPMPKVGRVREEEELERLEAHVKALLQTKEDAERAVTVARAALSRDRVVAGMVASLPREATRRLVKSDEDWARDGLNARVCAMVVSMLAIEHFCIGPEAENPIVSRGTLAWRAEPQAREAWRRGTRAVFLGGRDLPPRERCVRVVREIIPLLETLYGLLCEYPAASAQNAAEKDPVITRARLHAWRWRLALAKATTLPHAAMLLAQIRRFVAVNMSGPVVKAWEVATRRELLESA